MMHQLNLDQAAAAASWATR